MQKHRNPTGIPQICEGLLRQRSTKITETPTMGPQDQPSTRSTNEKNISLQTDTP